MRLIKKPLLSEAHLESIVGLPRSALRGLALEAEHLYAPFDRCRSRDGREKWRHIDNPLDRLKTVQAKLNNFLSSELDFPSWVIGGVRDRSPKDHASFHTGQPLVVAMDLADYFPSVAHARVFDGLRKHLGCSEKNARLMTKLTTLNGHLPHGAPTSTMMANIASLTMFEEITRAASDFGLRCSFYVDDIAMSGAKARDVIGPVRAIVRRFGHSFRRNKTDIMPRSQDQIVTGVLVNSHLSNDPKRLGRIRESILMESASTKPSARAARRIGGQIAYARWINSHEGASLEQLAEQLLPEYDDYDGPSDGGALDPTVRCTSVDTCRWRLQTRHEGTRSRA